MSITRGMKRLQDGALVPIHSFPIGSLIYISQLNLELGVSEQSESGATWITKGTRDICGGAEDWEDPLKP